MNQPLTIGDITVEPGEAKRGMIPVGNDMAGNPGGIPVIVYHGVKEGPRLWLNGATHGDEPEGPFSIFLALKELDPMQMARHGCGRAGHECGRIHRGQTRRSAGQLYV